MHKLLSFILFSIKINFFTDIFPVFRFNLFVGVVDECVENYRRKHREKTVVCKLLKK